MSLQKIIVLAYIPVTNVTKFSVSGESCSLSAITDFIKIDAPKGSVTAKISCKKSAPGDLYSITVSGNIKSVAQNLRRAIKKGVILRVTLANGRNYILGTKDFPLTGYISGSLAAKASDFSGYSVSLTGSQLHDMLQES